MRRILALFLAMVMMLSLTACGGKTADSKLNKKDDNGTVSESSNSMNDSADSDLDSSESVDNIEVDKGLFDVTLQIPADFVDEDKTQADYDVMAQEAGYKSITLNSDGSLTYVMTKTQHKELMEKMAAEFQAQLKDMCGSDDYPNFVSIKTNSDFTSFEIITQSEELDITESFSVLVFYMISGMYNVFDGTAVDNCKVTFINEASGAVISESNSADMG